MTPKTSTALVKYLMQNRELGTVPSVKMCLFQFVLQLEPNDVCKSAKGAKAKEHHLYQNHYITKFHKSYSVLTITILFSERQCIEFNTVNTTQPFRV